MVKNFIKTISFLAVLWVLHILQRYELFNIKNFSVCQSNGIFSTITGVFLHVNYAHLVSNTASLIVTIPLLLKLYKDESLHVIGLGIIVPSVSVYFLGQNIVGISGLVYTILWFLILRGLKSENIMRLSIGVILALLYANTLIGITPMAGSGISWQVHLVGFIMAIILSFRSVWITVKTNKNCL